MDWSDIEILGQSVQGTDVNKYQSDEHKMKMCLTKEKLANDIMDLGVTEQINTVLRVILDATESQGGYCSSRNKKENDGIYCIACEINMSAGLDEDLLDLSHTPVGLYFDLFDGSIHAKCVRDKRIIMTNDRKLLKKHQCPAIKIRNFITVPLVQNKRVIGMLAMCNRSEPYTEELLIYIKPLLNMLKILISSYRKDRELIYYKQKEREVKDFNFVSDISKYMYECFACFDAGCNLMHYSPIFSSEIGKFYPGGIRYQLNVKDFKGSNIERIGEIVNNCIKEGEDMKETIRFRSKTYKMTFELRAVHKDISGHPMCLLFMKDVTEKKKQKKLLRNTKKEYEKMIKLKNEYLSRISHELRTPLNAIIGFTQLLQIAEENETLSDGTMSEYVAYISKSGTSLLSLVEDVLNLSKVSGGKLHLSIERVVLKDIVDYCLKLFSKKITETGLRVINKTGGELCYMDYHKLQQVIINVLSNAIKYNRADGSIIIESSMLTEGENSYVYLTIKDTGIGISREKLKRLFHPFERLGMENSDIEGTGLGLALSKDLMKAMNGNIYCKSKRNKGTEFTIKCPGSKNTLSLSSSPALVRRKRGVSDPKDPDESESESDSGAVLYIEDNPSNVRLMEEIFSRHYNKKLQVAMSGERGLELSKSIDPSLIILDIGLPDISGAVVLNRLKRDEQTKHIPIIINSADASQTQIDFMLRAGATDYITKPINVKNLLKVIRKHLGNP